MPNDPDMIVSAEEAKQSIRQLYGEANRARAEGKSHPLNDASDPQHQDYLDLMSRYYKIIATESED